MCLTDFLMRNDCTEPFSLTIVECKLQPVSAEESLVKSQMTITRRGKNKRKANGSWSKAHCNISSFEKKSVIKHQQIFNLSLQFFSSIYLPRLEKMILHNMNSKL